MLTSLDVRDLVVIDRLELAFGPGFTVLTGETGAGKSIVLDALGLALGARGDRTLVRAGAERAQVVAGFAVPGDHPVRALLADQGIEAGDEILIRRQLGADGRSRAWIDDVPVSGGLLREAGSLLVEVHGQHASRALLEPGFHRELLDRFGGLGALADEVRARFRAWREAESVFTRLRDRLEEARRERDLLQAMVDELAELAVRPGEEEELAARRRRAMNREKLVTALAEIRELVAEAVERLGAAERRAQRAVDLEPGLGEAVAALGRAAIESVEAEAQIASALETAGSATDSLAEVEERLFALRDAARKYRCAVDELPARLAGARERLEAIVHGEEEVEAAVRQAAERRAAFRAAALSLREAREEAAARLAARVAAELAPLRLGRARFRVALEPLAEDRWGEEGAERVRFEAATNPGQPFGPLDRIASGGELSRFMLALELVIANLYPATTMIFDEVDAGIGGATAAAVGERLARLAAARQVVVVTHAPQVAARADRHILIEKEETRERTVVRARLLDEAARRDELARMLAGLEVTEAARAAASSLLAATGGSEP